MYDESQVVRFLGIRIPLHLCSPLIYYIYVAFLLYIWNACDRTAFHARWMEILKFFTSYLMKQIEISVNHVFLSTILKSIKL